MRSAAGRPEGLHYAGMKRCWPSDARGAGMTFARARRGSRVTKYGVGMPNRAKRGYERDRDRSRWLTRRVSRVTEHGLVRQTERERRMVDQTGIEPVTS